MSENKKIDLNNIKFELPNIKELIPQYSIPDISALKIATQQREIQQSMNAVCKAREEKEREELRRHNELVSTLKTAGENGATIVIGDNANSIQIQQNSNHSYQKFTNAQTFDYNKVSEVLNEIKDYANLPQFVDTFKENADNVKTIIYETLKEVENEGDVSLIKKSLLVLKDLTIGAASSLIATGILGLLNGIGV